MNSSSHLTHQTAKRLGLTNQWSFRQTRNNALFLNLQLPTFLKFQFDPVRINWRKPRRLWFSNVTYPTNTRLTTSANRAIAEVLLLPGLTPPPNRSKRLYGYYRNLSYFTKRQRLFYFPNKIKWIKRRFSKRKSKQTHVPTPSTYNPVYKIYNRFWRRKIFSLVKCYYWTNKLWKNIGVTAQIPYIQTTNNQFYGSLKMQTRKVKTQNKLLQHSQFFRRNLLFSFIGKLEATNYWLQKGRRVLRTYFRRRGRFTYRRPIQKPRKRLVFTSSTITKKRQKRLSKRLRLPSIIPTKQVVKPSKPKKRQKRNRF